MNEVNLTDLKKYCLEFAMNQSRLQLSKGDVTPLTELLANATTIENFILGNS